jgi:hypothetical protein
MKVWNQAAWRQNTYRVSERKMCTAVGTQPAEPLADDWCCHACGHHLCSCAPRGWRVAETSVDDAPEYRTRPTLTLSDVARLPVGTRVVVENDGECSVSSATLLELHGANSEGAVFFLPDRGYSWSICFDTGRRVTFRLAEDKPMCNCGQVGEHSMTRHMEWWDRKHGAKKPSSLTLDEAAAACRDGKVVRCVDAPLRTDLIGICFKHWPDRDRFRWSVDCDFWMPAGFPRYFSEDGASTMRFEVVS